MISVSVMAVTMWKSRSKYVESDDNKISYTTLLIFLKPNST
jgi:hypothetical protein